MTTSEQARADAMADAETLLSATRDRHRSPKQAHAAHKARMAGADACFNLRYPLSHDPLDSPVLLATTAARAAFRAVPGLRG